MQSNRFRLLALALTLSLALLATACGGGGASTSSGATAGGTGSSTSAADAPAESGVAVLGGGELALASLAGQDTVLWFWAPWCTVCRAEADDVVAAAAAVEGKVEVIGVAGRGEVSAMEAFVSDTGTGGLTHVVDDDGSIWSTYEVFSQPSFAFIDDSGNVEVFIGPLGEEALIERMNALAEA